jgi:hypothetical protein
MEKSKGVIEILDTFWNGYIKAFFSKIWCTKSVHVSYALHRGTLLTDDDFLDAYTRHHEIGIRFCDVIPHAEDSCVVDVLICSRFPVVVVVL